MELHSSVNDIIIICYDLFSFMNQTTLFKPIPPLPLPSPATPFLPMQHTSIVRNNRSHAFWIRLILTLSNLVEQQEAEDQTQESKRV